MNTLTLTDRLCKGCSKWQPPAAFLDSLGGVRHTCQKCRAKKAARNACVPVAFNVELERELCRLLHTMPGDPRSDWRADTGVVCWHPLRAAA